MSGLSFVKTASALHAESPALLHQYHCNHFKCCSASLVEDVGRNTTFASLHAGLITALSDVNSAVCWLESCLNKVETFNTITPS